MKIKVKSKQIALEMKIKQIKLSQMLTLGGNCV